MYTCVKFRVERRKSSTNARSILTPCYALAPVFYLPGSGFVRPNSVSLRSWVEQNPGETKVKPEFGHNMALPWPLHDQGMAIGSIYPNQDRYLATMGRRRPTPKALQLTRMMGQNWLRLY